MRKRQKNGLPGTAELADVILEMNHILNGIAAGDTDTFVKLK